MHHINTLSIESAHPTWCPGCGNFGIWTALKEALVELHIPPHETVIVFDIGCSGNGSNTIKTYGVHGLHGRALPLAEGIALANHNLTTIVISGDGGGYGEGGGHFLHALRANINLTYIVDDNQLYGLTKGQTSPTTPEGDKTTSAPFGNIDHPLNPMAVALATGGTFVARGFAGDIPHLRQLLKQAIQHQGFSFVDVMQPCVTFNHHATYAWVHERVVTTDALGYKPNDLSAAWALTQRTDGKIPIGLYYQESRKTFQQRLPQLTAGPLVGQNGGTRRIESVLSTLLA